MVPLKKERPTTVTNLVDRELRDRLERAAAAHERSLGGEVRALLRLQLSDGGEDTMSYIFDMPAGDELAGIAFFREGMCRSTLSGRVSPRFRPISFGSSATWLED